MGFVSEVVKNKEIGLFEAYCGFGKTIGVFGTDRVLYGSDTRIFPEGYRTQVLDTQLGIVKKLGLNDSEIKKIFSANAKKIFNV